MFWAIIVFIFAVTSARVFLMYNKEDIIEDAYKTLSDNLHYVDDDQVQNLALNCYKGIANSLNIVIVVSLMTLLLCQFI